MAQGYVQSSNNGHRTLEYMGDQYIKDLLSISFFQEVEVDDYGNITSFKMHDLIHDLAIGVAGSNCYSLTKSGMENDDYDESIRHISLQCYSMEKLPRRLLKAKGMRTLFCTDGFFWDMGLSCQRTIMSNLTGLRVLDLHSCGITKLPSSIGMLKHLRYLDLSLNGDLEGLPNSISNLLNLQTLKLNGCFSIKHLPMDITKLINLRYLMIEGCESLTHMPSGLGKLINLRYLMIDRCWKLTHMPSGLGKLTMMQKLPLFVVGNDKAVGHSCYGRLRELKGLNDLRGEIRIINLEKVGADDAALESKEAILKEKHLLQSLKLEWKLETEDTESDNAKEEHTTTAELVLEGLEPHPNLKALEIYSYCGVRFPSWMINMGNVVNISLLHCHRCQLLQPLDQLPCLKLLSLFNFKLLEYIQEEDYDNNQVRDEHPPPSSSSTSALLLLFFPSLQELNLQYLHKWKGWWKRRRESVSSSSSSLVFPSLTKLTIDYCPILTSMPLHPNMEELNIRGVSEKLLRERLTAEEERSLRSLRKLEIGWIPKLVTLPVGIQHLTTLQHLKIDGCDEFLAVPDWIGNLTQLQQLGFSECRNLASLPEEIRCLTSLQQLQIDKCSPKLSERCQNETGEDWLNIAHIPNIKIDGDIIQGTNFSL